MAGTAARFDAATDRVSYVPGPGDPPDGPFTICLWVYVSDASGLPQSLLRRYTAGGSSRGQIATEDSGTTLALTWYPSGLSFGYSLTAGQWARVAVTVGGAGEIITYAGDPTGALATAAGSSGTTAGANQVTLAALSVGNGGQAFNGRLARVRTWSAALTESELESEFASTVPIRTADLWADWPLATDLNDASGNARHLAAGSTAVTFTEDGPPDTAPPPHAEGAVTLSATTALAGTGQRGATGLVGLAATGTIGVSGVRSAAGTAQLATAAGFAPTGASHRSGTVTLAASAAVRVDPTGDQRDVTLTAALAPQGRITSTLGARRWAASLEAQP